MISNRKLGYKIPQIMLLLKNKEIISIQVAERLEFTMSEVSINKPSYIERRRSSRFDNRNPKGTKQVPSIIEQEQEHYKIRASATFNDDTYDYDLNSMKYVENREQ